MDAVARHYLVGPLNIWCIATKNAKGEIDLGVYIAAGRDHMISSSGATAPFLREPLCPSWGAWLATAEPGVHLLPPGHYRYRIAWTGHEEPDAAFDWFTYRELDSLAELSDLLWCELPFKPQPYWLGDMHTPYKPNYAVGAEIHKIQAELDTIEETMKSLLVVWRTLQAQREQWLLDWYIHNEQLPPEFKREFPGALKT